MLPSLGYGVLVLTLLVTLYSVGIALYGESKKSAAMIESARRAMLLTWPLLTITAAVLIYLLVNEHYEVEYVYSVTNSTMPLYLKITAWWGGQPGSLLFWGWLLSSFTSAVTLRKWDRDRELLPWVLVVAGITLAFFLALNVFFENPFRLIPGIPPVDGRGLNPLLRHPGMIIHPPAQYLGFVAFTIPFAFAIAALITGRTDDRWLRITRRWTLWAWLFLSLGLVLGMRWAYDVLGWGGYWGWDPVEIAALMPWLTGTAFLHSVMIQEKRGMLKHWNMILIILTFDLVLFGTFLTRSGVLSSVHAFAQSAIGPMFFVFIGFTFITSIGLLIYRWADLKSETEMNSMLSREALFLLNNLFFLSILVVSFWGVIFPLLSELFTGSKVTVGPPFYERATGPIWGGLILLMGVAPLSAWGHSTIKTLGRAIWKPALFALLAPIYAYLSGIHNWIALGGFTLVALVITVTLYEFWRGARARSRKSDENFITALWQLIKRNRRRYGGYIIHISMVLMAIGIIGIELFQTETQKHIAVNDTISLAGYDLHYDQLDQFRHKDGRWITRAEISVSKDGEDIGNIAPRFDIYPDGQPMTIPGVRSTLVDDIYVVLINWEGITPESTPFKVYHNPLVKWVWIGSYVFIIGILIAAWPEKED
ncbi:MAG: heme lyase CcmF/NrfE family subunit [Anaerolineales bacterium]|uniref:Heme lyase CcmF/NrfE family subunit n=1 Tax=Candidatus Desulfolinea nitratireducens TaxID=2841698 RepID=A0A8J6NHK4_9CHLR|nr:heme lyase CcmF/NrfE family subunit [Candidatus Desulfolinea nitratireducens]MBL6961265.1 heme lyase CcmF/NrfE family subunit [Anaerolineales bacterium]